MFKRIFFMLLLLTTLFVGVANAGLYENENDYIHATVNGEINWSEMTIRSKGKSKDFIDSSDDKAAYFTSEEAAISDAQYNLFETLKEVPLSSSYYIDDSIYLYAEVKSGLKALLPTAKVIGAPVVHDDGSTEVILELSLTGKVLDMMFPKKENLPKGLGKPFQGRGRYTSIIFNAQELKFSPVLLPLIIDSNDEIYHDLNKKNRKMAVKNGMVRYYKSLEAAKKSAFAGKKPYIIEDVQLHNYKEDTLLSHFAILEKVRNNAFYSEIISRCKVIIVIK